MVVANRRGVVAVLRGALAALALSSVVVTPAFAAPKKGGAAPAPAAKAPEPPKPAPDTEAPVISCTPPTNPQPGRVKVDFSITDQSALFGVLFHWRQVGETNYRQLDFPSAQPVFTAEFDVQKDFEFWIEAYDEAGNGPALFGSSEAPKKVTVEAPPPVVADKFEQIDATTPLIPKDEIPTGSDNLVTHDNTKMASGPVRNTQVLRVLSGRALPMKMFEVRANADFTFGSDFLYPTASVSGQAMKLGITYQALDFLAVGLNTAFGRASLSSSGSNAGSGWPLTASSGTDIGLNARVTSGPLGAARLGLIASIDLPALSDIKGSERAASPGLMGLATIDTPAFRLHFNAGYKWDNSENTLAGRWGAFNAYALGVSRYDDLHFGLAAEIPVDKIVPYAEWTLDVPVNRRQFSTCDGAAANKTCVPNPALFPAAGWQIPQRLGLGGRYEINPLMAADLGLELSLTRAGRGYGDATSGSLVPLEGLPPPAPFAVRLNFTYQFGTAYEPEVAPDGGLSAGTAAGKNDPF